MKPVSNQAVKLSELLEHSHAMLERAEAGEWETVVSDEVIQRELIDALFSMTPSDTDEAVFRESLEEVLQINRKLETLAVQARDQVQGEVNTISAGRKAVQAYTANSR